MTSTVLTRLVGHGGGQTTPMQALLTASRKAAAGLAVCLLSLLAACSSSGGGPDNDGTAGDRAGAGSFVSEVRRAAQAVEAELGGTQEFFEITATPQLTNVFVVTDGGTSAVPYVFLDGELQPPAPMIEGVAGHAFTLDAVDFDEATVLDGVISDLPAASLNAFSVEGGPGGVVRYVIAARSAQGGVLDVVVSRSGAVLEVITL